MSIIALTEQRLPREPTKSTALVEASLEKPKKVFSDALSAIVAYVPTEIIAAYTLVLATVGAQTAPVPMWTFWVFLGLTPLFVWLVYAVRSVEQGKDIPLGWNVIPLWEAIAATIAFGVWSATLPRSALRGYSWYDPDVAAFVLVVISIVLPLVGVLVAKRRST
jgi:hypothetical protein